MAEFHAIDPHGPPSPSGQVDRMLRKYFGNPDLPQAGEVRRLLDDLVLRNAELESKVTHLKSIVQHLEAYRDRYVDLYELAPVGYATLDEDGYVQEINLAGSQLLGWDRDAIIGQPFENHLLPGDQEGFRQQIRDCCCRQHILTLEVDLIAKDTGLTTISTMVGLGVVSIGQPDKSIVIQGL